MPWLMKAEPDSRIEKGKDVKFSVDDFEKIGISQWDGVRSHEAKKIMKEKMKVGDKVLFYHSNTKTPGVFAEAEVAREGYPDYTAWDPSHPYYDPKTDQANPTWYMVDVRFIRRIAHPPTLALIKHLFTAPVLPVEVGYIGEEGWAAIKGMALVNRGRLSVQPVDDTAYDTIIKLGSQGGWEDLVGSKKRTTSNDDANETPKKAAKPRSRKHRQPSDAEAGGLLEGERKKIPEQGTEVIEPLDSEKKETEGLGRRRSKRTKR